MKNLSQKVNGESDSPLDADGGGSVEGALDPGSVLVGEPVASEDGGGLREYNGLEAQVPGRVKRESESPFDGQIEEKTGLRTNAERRRVPVQTAELDAAA